MKTKLHKADTRGYFDHGWLETRHTFSFANYYDPERTHFGKLRVLNDDSVAPGEGFGTHPHENMEIVSIPLKGALAHKDSGGHEEVIKPGEVQVMSAGTGIYHSEYNASDTEATHFLQIWVFPDKQGHEPRYDQKSFDLKDRHNKLQFIVSPERNNGSLWLNQNAWFSMIDLDQGKKVQYDLHNTHNGVYLFVLVGSVTVSETKLDTRDGLAIWETEKVLLTADTDSQILIIEIPML